MRDHHTIGDLAKRFALPTWKVRRAVDLLDEDVPRAGLYRLVPQRLVPAVADQLRRRGWLPELTEAAK